MHNRSTKMGEEWRKKTVADNGLVGNYTHSLDAKNRVFFPAKFREDLGSPIIITINVDKCLSAYSASEWDTFVKKLGSYPKSQVKEIKRIFCGNAIKVVPDGQGRVMVDKKLLDFAGITDSITFVGCGDSIELWAEKKDPLCALDDALLSDIGEKMLELDI
ncbi:MAG: division/cell wall cluster transcriptional repressor MraZ [Ruminococcaceae bacterium]|nr:division/cell wall cluster transcriptional repressor MraZ [Oscillospiraceae bacterium]